MRFEKGLCLGVRKADCGDAGLALGTVENLDAAADARLAAERKTDLAADIGRLTSISEDQPSSSVANNGEVKERTLLQRPGEVVNSSGGQSLENGSARHSSRRVGGRNRKEDGFVITGEGKSSRRGGGGGGGGPNSQEKQMWIQKSSSGT